MNSNTNSYHHHSSKTQEESSHILAKESNPFRNSFADPNYLQRLPRLKRQFSSKIDETKTLLFRLGSNPVYIDETFVYIGQENNKPVFCNVNDTNDKEYGKIKFDPDLMKLLSGNIIEEIKKVGWIVLDGKKWGFLLDLNSLDEVYKGHLPLFW